jgi:hypothetical protein
MHEAKIAMSMREITFIVDTIIEFSQQTGGDCIATYARSGDKPGQPIVAKIS